MKKILAMMLAVLSCLLLFAGCGETKDPDKDNGKDDDGGKQEETVTVETYAAMYAKTGEATAVGQTIVIMNGSLTQYESEKTYTKTGDGYTVKGTEKKLNGLDADTAYTETAIDTTVAAGTFEATLKLDESYYTGLTVTETELKATVKDGHVKDALSLSGELPATPYEVKLTMTADGTHITAIGIAYVSGSSNVSISLTFTY